MLKTICITVVFLVAIFIGVVAFRPADFSVTRSTTIAAPPATIFAHINNFHRWPDWSPWAKMDPNMKTTYSGPESGVGASSAWSGNEDVGEGRMTIVESKPDSVVRIKLEFLKPFATTNVATFTLTTEAAKTRVTWSMKGHNTFLFKAVGLFMNIDKMVGDDFERGLSQLETASASGAAPAPAGGHDSAAKTQ